MYTSTIATFAIFAALVTASPIPTTTESQVAKPSFVVHNPDSGISGPVAIFSHTQGEKRDESESSQAPMPAFLSPPSPKAKAVPGRSSRRKEIIWSGEWNDDMDQVIRRLRQLK